MSNSLIDMIYERYLRVFEKGSEFEVPVTITDQNGQRVINIRVWAKNASEATRRAEISARVTEYRQNEHISEKSLGLVLPTTSYKGRGAIKTMGSSFAVWKDPTYKKGWGNISRSCGIKAGTMTRTSISELKGQLGRINQSEEISPEILNKSLNINIVSFFIWAGILVLGIIFMAAGFSPSNEDKFIIKWLNSYIIAGIICMAIGAIAIYKTFIDYKWIIKKLTEFDNMEINRDTSDGH